QLLYAVIQVDKREADLLKLNCRWFDDLTKIDQTLAEACDRAFDRAKSQSQRFNPSAERNMSQKKMVPSSPSTEASPQAITLLLHAHRLRLSHLLQLKEKLRAAKGSVPLILEFHDEQRLIGKVLIEGRWGISPSAKLKEELSSLPYVREWRH